MSLAGTCVSREGGLVEMRGLMLDESRGHTAVSGEVATVELLGQDHGRPADVSSIFKYGLTKGELYTCQL